MEEFSDGFVLLRKYYSFLILCSLPWNYPFEEHVILISMYIWFMLDNNTSYICTYFVESFLLNPDCQSSSSLVLCSMLCVVCCHCFCFHFSCWEFHPFFFFLCLVFIRMISIADVTKASLNGSHFEFPLSFCPFYLLLTLPIYFSYIFGSFNCLSYLCAVSSIFVTWLLTHSTFWYFFQFKTAYLNLLLVVILSI